MRKRLIKTLLFFVLFTGICIFNISCIEDESSDLRVKVAGMTSWYSCTDPGILPTTANMETFDDTRLTCAMWGVPFNTWIEVTNPENKKSVIVRVNDRGPAYRFVRQNRVIDLTKAAFAKLADTKKGLLEVEVEILYSET